MPILAEERAVSRLILDLYRGARERDPDAFCTWALSQVRRLVPFDSAMWGHGSATAERVDLVDVHLLEQPVAMLESYARVRHEDFLARAVGAAAGTTIELYSIVDRDTFVRSPIYRRHARRYGMENLLCTGHPERPSGLMSVISFWRARPENRFTEVERATKEFLVPHLVEARRLCVLAAVRRRTGITRVTGVRAAVCDRRGILHEVEDGFAALIGSQWPDWTGPSLPAPLVEALRAGGHDRMAFGALRFDWSPLDRRILIGVRRATAVDALTRRERAIVERLARGATAKRVALEMRLEPTTVRNHLASAHRKLGVRNRAQLLQALLAEGVLSTIDDPNPADV